jgi:hypothetical protein
VARLRFSASTGIRGRFSETAWTYRTLGLRGRAARRDL